MKGFLETVAGLGIFAVFLLGISVVYGLVNGDSLDQVAPLIGWGLAIGVIALILAGIARSIPLNDQQTRNVEVFAAPADGNWGEGRIAEQVVKPRWTDATADLVWDGPAENEQAARRFAAALSMGGMTAIMARQWASAFERDRSVAEFGVRPYWTPTGPGGSPELLSIVGLKGATDREQYAREIDIGDVFLAIMEDDPDPRVRQVASSRRLNEPGAWRDL